MACKDTVPGKSGLFRIFIPLLIWLSVAAGCIPAQTGSEESPPISRELILSPSGQMRSELLYYYHSDGRKKKEEYFRANGDRVSRIVYRYGLHGRIRRVAFYESGMFPVGSKRFQYNDIDQLVSICDTAKDSTGSVPFTEYLYDDLGRIIREISHREGQKQETIRLFQGEQIIHEERVVDGETVSSREFFYDDQDRMCKVQYFDGSGTYLRGEEYFYDTSGLLMEKRIVRESNIVSISRYTYLHRE